MPTNIDTSKLTPGEIELLQWQFGGDLGHFKKSLWQAIQCSDLGNLDRLSQGFPDQVTAYRRFTSEAGFWQDVLVRSGLIPPPPVPANDPNIETPPSPPSYDH